MLRGFWAYTKNHSLANQECSKPIIRCLTGDALEFYLREIEDTVAYKIAVEKQNKIYSKPHHKKALQSEVGSLSLDDFITCNHIQDEKQGLRELVIYLNEVTLR